MFKEKKLFEAKEIKTIKVKTKQPSSWSGYLDNGRFFYIYATANDLFFADAETPTATYLTLQKGDGGRVKNLSLDGANLTSKAMCEIMGIDFKKHFEDV